MTAVRSCSRACRRTLSPPGTRSPASTSRSTSAPAPPLEEAEGRGRLTEGPLCCPLRPMFTIQQINDLHDRLGNMETFAQYVRALKSIGVETFDSYLSDGHSEFFGIDGYTVASPAAHEQLSIADT